MKCKFTPYLAGAAVVAATVFFGLTTAAEARERLVIANWGGVFGESLEKNVLESFRKEHDVEVVIHRQSSASDTLAKLRAEKGNPTIDIYFATWGGAASLAKEGLTEGISEKDVPEIANYFPQLVGRHNGETHWLAINPKSRGIAIRRDLVKVPDEVTVKWWLSKDLKGQIAIPRLGWGRGAILLLFSLANGGSEKNIGPGFEFAKKAASNINVIYRTSGEAVRLLTTGEAAVSFVNSNAAAKLYASGLDVGFYNPSDAPLYLGADAVLAVKGGPGGRDVAMKFLKHFTQPDKLNAYSYGTGSSSPLAKAPTPPKEKVPFPFDPGLIDKAFFPRGEVAATVNKNFDAWSENWKREIIPILGK